MTKLYGSGHLYSDTNTSSLSFRIILLSSGLNQVSLPGWPEITPLVLGLYTINFEFEFCHSSVLSFCAIWSLFLNICTVYWEITNILKSRKTVNWPFVHQSSCYNDHKHMATFISSTPLLIPVPPLNYWETNYRHYIISQDMFKE